MTYCSPACKWLNYSKGKEARKKDRNRKGKRERERERERRTS